MFKNYATIAWRNIVRHKGYSFINIFGLAVGLACFLLLVLYIQFERSYDVFHKNRHDVYLAIFDNKSAEHVESKPITGAPLAPLLLQQFPSIEYAVRLTCFEGETVSRGERQFTEKHFVFADESVFRVFTFPLKSGNERTALQNPFSVVLTPESTKKYFGSENPLGKVLTYVFQGKKYDFSVSGVLEPIPANSHLQFDFLASFQSLRSIIKDDWFFTNHWDSPTWTYVKLKSGTKVKEINRLMPTFCNRFVDKRSFQAVNCRLMSLPDVYFQSGRVIGVSGNIDLLKILALIAFFILLIACINYTNLATARSELLAREIGMRKTCGASHGQLVTQFLTESLIFSFLALLLSTVLFELFLPIFSSLIDKPLPIHFFNNGSSLAITILSGFIVGLLAGIYPAFFLSRRPPHLILKTGVGKNRAGSSLRKALVVGQFTVSIVFIVCVLLMFKQMRFLHNMDIGFDKNQVIVLPIRDSAILNNFEILKNLWQQHTAVLGVTAASFKPGIDSPNGTNLNARGNKDVKIGIVYVDPDFVKTMGIQMLQGRDFSGDIASDASSALLMNEEALKKLNWQIGIGEPIETFFKENGKIEPFFKATVIGVVKNINFQDLTSPFQPLLIKIARDRYTNIMIRLDGKNSREGIAHVRKTWMNLNFNQPFEFTFLDNDMEAVYRSTNNANTIVGYSALLAIIIACLGLFGLASFTAERRTKEVGIRKILGDSVLGISRLLCSEFLKLVLLANLIAWPLAYYYISNWLQSYAFRTVISIDIFILAGLLALLVALLTVGGKSVRAARANPVESLRYE
jgi:putative ABC transport system permease protein